MWGDRGGVTNGDECLPSVDVGDAACGTAVGVGNSCCPLRLPFPLTSPIELPKKQGSLGSFVSPGWPDLSPGVVGVPDTLLHIPFEKDPVRPLNDPPSSFAEANAAAACCLMSLEGSGLGVWHEAASECPFFSSSPPFSCAAAGGRTLNGCGVSKLEACFTAGFGVPI